MINLTVNGRPQSLDAEPDTPILWAVREEFKLTGTKFGCGAAQCGACTVHLNGTAIRSCVTPVSSAEGAQITTIEGVGGTASARPFRPPGWRMTWPSAATARAAR
jgi:isoquinoline 1-oxidoreductase alpha subunit